MAVRLSAIKNHALAMAAISTHVRLYEKDADVLERLGRKVDQPDASEASDQLYVPGGGR